MFGVRMFKRLNIAYDAFTFESFFLERMAYVQWRNKPPFTRGPFIRCQTAKEEYDYWTLAGQINHSLDYYMKPHKMLVFGFDVQNTKIPHLMTRVWLQSELDMNFALVIMERIDYTKDKDYIVAINNSSWRPYNFSKLETANELQQTLLLTNKPYDGCYEV